MAKDIFHKKKRITHMGTFTSEDLGERRHVSSDCIDYVSSIIQDMDSDFKKNINCSKIHPQKKFAINKLAAQVLLPEALDISAVQNSKPSTSKLKKYSLTRKFPLMEKSQRILKHIKHNRSIPKPRAHLASADKFPEKQLPLEGPKLLKGKVKKLNENMNYKSNIVSTNMQSIKKPNNSISENKEKLLEKNNELVSNGKSQNFNYSVNNLKKSTCRQNSIDNSDAKVSACSLLENNGETTDSEYERFVQNTKRELPEKSSNKTKLIRKKKFSKKSKKANVLSKKGDADESDCDRNIHKGAKVTVSKSCVSSFSDKKGRAKLKSSSNSFHCNVDDADAVCSSSEQDEIADYSFEVSNPVESDSMDDISNERFCSNVTNRHPDVLNELSNGISTFKDISLDNISNNVTIVDKIVSENNLQNHIQESDKCQSSFNLSLTATSLPVSVSEEVNSKTATDFSSVIDLCSDSEPEDNVSTPILENRNISEINNKDLDIMSNKVSSEDSDLEIIEVISSKPTNINMVKMDKIEENYIFQQSNHSNSSSLNISSEISCNTDRLLVPEINSANCEENKCNSKVKIKKENASKHDAAYVTNICKERVADISNLNSVNRNINSLTYEDDSGKLNTSTSSISHKECIPINSQNICSKQLTNAVIVPNKILELKKEIVAENASQSCSESFITSNGNLCHMQNAEKLIKREILDEDLIIIDDTELSEKNDSKANSLSYVMSNAICDVLKSKVVQQNADEESEVGEIARHMQVKSESPLSFSSFVEKHIGQYKGKPHNLQSELIKKELHLLDTVFPNSDILNDSKLSHDIVDNFKIKLSKLDESSTIDRTDVIHLVELYKKEFKNYQRIVKTEQNVEAGLKLVEAYQAEKLKDIRSVIQQLLKNDSTFGKTYNLDIKEEPESMYRKSDLNSFNKSSNLTCSSKQHSEDNSEIIYLPSDISPNLPLTVKAEKMEISSSSYENEASTAFSHSLESKGKQTLKLLGKHCNVCGKEAIAACQRCAKAFFCSDRCGKIFWNRGHEKICG